MNKENKMTKPVINDKNQGDKEKSPLERFLEKFDWLWENNTPLANKQRGS